MKEEHTTLHYREGRSDKVYQVDLERAGDGWVVNVAWGRRGTTLTPGTKTKEPVPYAKAKTTYDATVREKTSKGYSPGTAGQRFQGTEFQGQATTLQPQLLNDVEEARLEELLTDEAYGMQEKYDGKRLLVEKTGDVVRGVNRRGLVVALPEGIADAVQALAGDVVLDGEIVGDTYHVFDAPAPEPYLSRLERLDALLGRPTLRHDPRAVRSVWTAIEAVSKRNLLDEVRRHGGEGVVFKRLDAPYTPGRPASGGPQLKLKFTTTASCLVLRHNAGKRSVVLGLVDGDATVEVGSVTIPPNHALPEPGLAVEIRYLYAFPGGALYQPVYLGERDDVPPSDCVLAQLKLKAGPEDA